MADDVIVCSFIIVLWLIMLIITAFIFLCIGDN